MSKSLRMAALALMLVPAGIPAHEIPAEPRIAAKSEAVVRNDLRQLGIAVRDLEMQGGTALIEATVDGRPAVLEMNLLNGRTRLVSGDPAVRARIARRLHRAYARGPVAPVEPRQKFLPKR